MVYLAAVLTICCPLPVNARFYKLQYILTDIENASPKNKTNNFK